MNNPPMMECGHVANAKDYNGNPICIICLHITEGADKVKQKEIDLKGRTSICPYCKELVASSKNLAFFEYRPQKENDLHYCGCRGWN